MACDRYLVGVDCILKELVSELLATTVHSNRSVREVTIFLSTLLISSLFFLVRWELNPGWQHARQACYH